MADRPSWRPDKSQSGWKGGRVLVVDDDETVRETLTAILTEDFVVEAVPHVEAALEALAQRPFDLVVTDFEMPDGTGADVLRTIQAHHPFVNSILLTGRTDSREVRAINEKGDVMVLLKPVAPAELLTWVRNGVTMSRLRRARAGR